MSVLDIPIRGKRSVKGGTTVQIDLPDDQAAELRLLLDGALGELSHEIADTDNPRFRQRLRDRRSALEAVARQLGPARDATVDA